MAPSITTLPGAVAPIVTRAVPRVTLSIRSAAVARAAVKAALGALLALNCT